MKKVYDRCSEINYHKKLMNRVGLKLTVLVSIAILFSVSLVGYGAYSDLKRVIEQRVGETGLLNLVALKAVTIEKIIHSGIEVSRSLAQDATLQEWFKGNEEDEELGILAKKKLNFIVEELGYRISFATNIHTLNFWTHEKLTDTLSEKDPDDFWFFYFLHKGNPVEINVEPNNKLNELFVWVNALMGTSDEPVGVAGVGLSFKESIDDFTSNEFGEFGKVWLVNEKGEIQIDEQVENLDRQVQNFIPAAVLDNFLTNEESGSIQILDHSSRIGTFFDWKQEVIFVLNRIDDTDSIIIFRIDKARWIWSLLAPYLQDAIFGSLTVLMIVASLFTLISFFISKIFTRLSQAILTLGEGNFDSIICEADLMRKDELGDFARGLETTRTKLFEAYNTLTALNKTFERFVPRQFLNRIAKRGIEQISLGDGESAIITVLFSDIRSFTSLSEKMSPQDLLSFMNSYFKQMNRPIHKNHGFIDKFIGDAIMALFDIPDGDNPQDEANNAVFAAIGMQEALKEFNVQREKSGYEPISIGIGINSGPVVIGTVGSEDRMDSTVLGDSVNMASRLEGLTKRYHSKIIISSQTYQLLKTAQTSNDLNFHCRKLDFVSVKGKEIPEVIYEVFSSDPEEIRDKKLQTFSLYHQGVESYYSRNWEESIQFFQECLKVYPEDFVSKMYLERCIECQNNPPPLDWDGASHLTQK